MHVSTLLTATGIGVDFHPVQASGIWPLL